MSIAGLSKQKETFLIIRASQDILEDCGLSISRDVQAVSERRLSGIFYWEFPNGIKIRKEDGSPIFLTFLTVRSLFLS